MMGILTACVFIFRVKQEEKSQGKFVLTCALF